MHFFRLDCQLTGLVWIPAMEEPTPRPTVESLVKLLLHTLSGNFEATRLRSQFAKMQRQRAAWFPTTGM